MDEEKKEDVNTEKETQEDSSPSEETAESASEGVKDTSEKEVTDEEVDQLLADGTSPQKEVKIPYVQFQEKNEKSKLFDQFAPLLSRLSANPELVDRLMKGESKDSLEAKVARLEETERIKRLEETKNVLKEAMTVWPNFKSRWDEMRPIIESLEKQGVSYADAVQRSYYAINPEEAQKAVRLAAQTRANKLGTVSSVASVSKVTQQEPKEAYQMLPEDQEFVRSEFARSIGVDPKLYTRNSDWIEYLRRQGI